MHTNETKMQPINVASQRIIFFFAEKIGKKNIIPKRKTNGTV